MLVVEQYLNIRLLLKQCPFCLEYLSEKKNKKGENAQKVKKTLRRLSRRYERCPYERLLHDRRTPVW